MGAHLIHSLGLIYIIGLGFPVCIFCSIVHGLIQSVAGKPLTSFFQTAISLFFGKTGYLSTAFFRVKSGAPLGTYLSEIVAVKLEPRGDIFRQKHNRLSSPKCCDGWAPRGVKV
jgi:hypothetical protein